MQTKKKIKFAAQWWREMYLKGWNSTCSEEMVQEMVWLSKHNPKFDHLKFIKAVFIGE